MENPSTGSANPNPAPSSTPQNNTLMAVLSYIGPLVFIPYLTAKNDPFVKFHIKQGLVLIVIEILIFAANLVAPFFMIIFGLINLGTFILSIVGIVWAVQGKEKELPLVGQFASHFKF